MEQITSRGQLVDLVNRGIETYTHSETERKIILHTILHNKKNKEYYRIEWGMLKDNEENSHLWFQPNLVKVELDKRSTKWMTASESHDYIEQNEDNISWMYKDGLLFINGETRNFKEEKKVSIVGGKTGSGKSEYAYTKTAKQLKEGKTVLFFSTEFTEEEVLRRILRALVLDIYTKVENNEPLTDEEQSELDSAKRLLAESKLKIYYDCSTEGNCVIRKMYEAKDSELGLDLVVIDSLTFINDSYKDVVEIHSQMDKHRQILDCRVIITTNLNPKSYEKFTK